MFVLRTKGFLVALMVYTLFYLYNYEKDGFTGSDSVILSFAGDSGSNGALIWYSMDRRTIRSANLSGKGTAEEGEGSNSRADF